MRRGILIPATAVVATALYFWYEERKKRRNQMDADMTSLVEHAKMVVQTPRPHFMEMPPSPLARRSVTDVNDTRDSPTSTSAANEVANAVVANAAPVPHEVIVCDSRPMVVAVLLLSYLAIIALVSSVITLYRLC